MSQALVLGIHEQKSPRFWAREVGSVETHAHRPLQPHLLRSLSVESGVQELRGGH